MVVGDWGSANFGSDVTYKIHKSYCGGTPIYAGPDTFGIGAKDLFSFCRLAMELMCGKKGTESSLSSFSAFDNLIPE